MFKLSLTPFCGHLFADTFLRHLFTFLRCPGGEDLASSGRKNPRSRWNQIVIARKRDDARLARRLRTYRPDRWSEEHEPRRNPRFKVTGKRRGTATFKFPETLQISSLEDSVKLLDLLKEVRTAALQGKHKRIVLDHSNLRYMDPEAALLVLSEIQRCEAYCNGKTEITGTHPRVHEVAELLEEIGFYAALKIKPPKLPDSYKRRTYVRIERRDRIASEVADSLLDCFSKERSFSSDDRKRLHVALVECMDNVYEHAYDPNSGDPYLYKEWWLAGYADHSDSSIGFIFYDQGMGIPSTIKRRKRSLIERSKHLLLWNNSRWIERAVLRPISRHKSKRRGHGLDRLKRFLDGLDVDGTLRVIANNGDVEFLTSGQTLSAELPNDGLNGTLIVWKLRGVEGRALETGSENNYE